MPTSGMVRRHSLEPAAWERVYQAMWPAHAADCPRISCDGAFVDQPVHDEELMVMLLSGKIALRAVADRTAEPADTVGG